MKRKHFIFTVSAAALFISSGFRVKSADQATFATTKKRRLLTATEKFDGVVLVVVAPENTTLSIYKEAILSHEQVIPFGTKPIYDSVGLYLNKSLPDTKKGIGEAKDYFLKNAACYSPEGISRVGKLRMRAERMTYSNIAHTVQKQFESIFERGLHVIKNSGNSENVGCGMVITGDLTDFPEVVAVAKLCTRLKCRLA